MHSEGCSQAGFVLSAGADSRNRAGERLEALGSLDIYDGANGGKALRDRSCRIWGAGKGQFGANHNSRRSGWPLRPLCACVSDWPRGSCRALRPGNSVQKLLHGRFIAAGVIEHPNWGSAPSRVIRAHSPIANVRCTWAVWRKADAALCDDFLGMGAERQNDGQKEIFQHGIHLFH